ncbi:uncharacterized protein BYT42DRAFT_569678 [Radiomyces spectabilis]|uniref:uncharacterized protein n=1 Tax=Radiomyces spectabilis TaxID=64574 RepID=UPI00221F3F61|nr:uncharacterized protein BYT42DRAFT_569678 [Radiomyces spectabilis]KAI8379695.1 hypothetical protein BYT42DRAFT_569678 [Radiomyces spectabilis]
MTKDKSSTPKFWKKLGLGKNKTSHSANALPTISSTPNMHSPSAQAADSESIKSKRFSTLFHPQKRASTQSLRKQRSDSIRPPLPVSMSTPDIENIVAQTTGKESDNTIPTDIPKHVKQSDNVPDIESAAPPRSTSSATETPSGPQPMPSKDDAHNRNLQNALSMDQLPRSVTHTSVSSCAVPDSSAPNKSLNRTQSSATSIDTTHTKATTTSSYHEPTPETEKYNPTEFDHDDDDTVEQLKSELEKQRYIVRVLQGQKEAVTKDLDYFSQVIDEITEEKEALTEKYNEEKSKNQTKEEDLNILLEKLKASNNNAREKAFEAERSKLALENVQAEALKEMTNLKSQLKERDSQILELKSELGRAQDRIQMLQQTMEALLRSQSQREPLETKENAPAISPVQTIAAEEETPTLQPPTSEHGPREDLSKSQKSSSRSLSQPTPTVSHQDDLDEQLKLLTEEKEKLQNVYSKIPLSGGGPMSRRRKEELEEMLDEVDCQLSKVKQKIRRS